MEKIEAGDYEAQSADPVAENIDKLKTLFPELITEGKDGAAINVDVLKQLVGDTTVTDADEKYGLNWHGKRRARQLALTPSTGTLRPCPEDSVDWDTTQNLMIEGDNLEVLKLLQKSYAGKVKLIYIDPPYNTGKDFVYPDNYRDGIKNYMELTGQTEEGAKVSSNSESSGRFHTDWLNMMYPRLKLARVFLREDGAIFITVDDEEVSHLRDICDDIFGEENFIADVVWQKKYAPQNDATYFSDMHDHILVYAKLAKRTKNDEQGWNLSLLPRTESQNAAYKNPDDDPRGVWQSDNLSVKTYSAQNDYPITTPSGRVVSPPKGRCWSVSKERFSELLEDNRIWFASNGKGVPRLKRFLSEVQDGTVPVTWWTYSEVGHNQDAKKELKELMGTEAETIFDTPKPIGLIRRMLQLTTKSSPDAVVMDFFAGSGATGHAVLQYNAEVGGDRRYILVQLPEPVGTQNIADLTKERLRRTGVKVREEYTEWGGDTGFRVFKLDRSNIKAWNPKPDDLETSLADQMDHLAGDRTEQDILYELLLKLGLDLCVPIETRELAGKDVHAVGGGVLMACLAKTIERDAVEPLAQGIVDWHRELDTAGDVTCVFCDSAFADDVTKTNMAAILEQHGIANVRSL